MYSYEPPDMAGQKQDDLLEYTYSSYVRIRDVALKTCRRIGRSGERGSGISVQAVRYDDDDDDDTWNPFVKKINELVLFIYFLHLNITAVNYHFHNHHHHHHRIVISNPVFLSPLYTYDLSQSATRYNHICSSLTKKKLTEISFKPEMPKIWQE